jgi:hypothetical protein
VKQNYYRKDEIISNYTNSEVKKNIKIKRQDERDKENENGEQKPS